MLICVVQTSFSAVWLVDVCHVQISHRAARGSLSISYESHFSFAFFPLLWGWQEKISWRKLENKAAQEAAQGVQQSLFARWISDCQNFRISTLTELSSAPSVTLHAHTHSETARHTGECPHGNPTHSRGTIWDCPGPSDTGTVLAWVTASLGGWMSTGMFPPAICSWSRGVCSTREVPGVGMILLERSYKRGLIL